MTNTRRPRLGPKGLTLLELVVTLAILGMVGAIAVQAFRVGGRSWEKGERRAEAEQRTRILVGILGQDLASVLATTALVDGKGVVAFRGGPDWIFFHCAPTGHGPLPFGAMVRSVAYSVQPGRGLIVQESYPLMEGNVSLDPRGAQKVMDPEVAGVRFRYLAAASSADEAPRWLEAWDAPESTDAAPTDSGQGRGGRRGNVPRDRSDAEAALPLAVEVTIITGEALTEHALTLVFPIRVGRML